MQIERSNPTSHFTIIPNGTLQDHGLSFMARGILVYLVSLPDGSRESIKTLAGRSREGRTAVANAMRELEAAGFLKRVKRHADGAIGTRLVVSDAPMVDSLGPAIVDSTPVGPGITGQEVPKDLPSKNPTPTQPPTTGSVNPNPTQPPNAPAAQVGSGSVEMTQTEKALAGLAAIDGRLHLTAADVASLTPLADEWFARGADERRFAAVLTLGLPETINHPAAFLRRRLTDKMPAARPSVAAVTAPQAARHLCPECERPKASEGLCADCSVKDATPVEPGSRDWRQMARQFGVGALAA